MSCELCGGGDIWIKTCLTTAGSRIRVCDLCYEEYECPTGKYIFWLGGRTIGNRDWDSSRNTNV